MIFYTLLYDDDDDDIQQIDGITYHELGMVPL